MAAVYHTQEGEVLDWICWRYYGREDAVEAVLEANPGLADRGPRLPSGLTITLPDLPKPVKQTPTLRLWD